MGEGIDGVTETSVELVPHCEYHCESKICGLDKEGAKPCEYHKAKERKPDQQGRIIKKPIYGSLDEAAMAAANIIRYHICEGCDNVEYCISIYEKECDEVV
jgi:hypothetical protein